MPFKLHTVLSLFACLILVACGGGSSSNGSTQVPTQVNSPDGSWLSFNPPSLEVTTYEGESNPIQLTATSSKTISRNFNVAIVDGAGTITPDVKLSEQSLLQYKVQLTTSANLKAGSHSTNLEVRLCEDDPVVCRTPLPGSPWYIPLKVNVKTKAEAAARLSTSVDHVDLIAYEGEQQRVSIDAKISGDLVGQNYYVAAVDPVGVTVAGGAIYNATARSFNAIFEISPKLAPGNYSSNLEIRLCRNASVTCKEQVAGSPWIVPMKVTVKSNINLSPLKTILGLSSWSTYQGNAAHTGYVPASFNIGNFSRRWKVPALKNIPSNINSVANDDGLMFLTGTSPLGQTEVVAISEDTGVDVWRRNLGKLSHINPPAAANGRVYVTSTGHQDSYFWVFDQKTGDLLSKTATSSQWEKYRAPTVFGTDVYTEYGYYGGMAKFTGAGKVVWSKGLDQYESWTPSVDARYAYVYMNGKLLATSITDGALAFQIENQPQNDSFFGLPVVLSDNQSAFVVTGNQLVAFDLLKRTRAWFVNISSGRLNLPQPVYGNGSVYMFNLITNEFEARAPDTGNLQWGSKLQWASNLQWASHFDESDPLNSIGVEHLIATKNLAFISSQNRTVAIDLMTHKVVWSYPMGGDLSISSRGVLYILSEFGDIAAINLL